MKKIRKAILVYPTNIKNIDMNQSDFDLEELRKKFDSDLTIYRIEFTENGIITDCWEKEADK